VLSTHFVALGFAAHATHKSPVAVLLAVNNHTKEARGGTKERMMVCGSVAALGDGRNVAKWNIVASMQLDARACSLLLNDVAAEGAVDKLAIEEKRHIVNRDGCAPICGAVVVRDPRKQLVALDALCAVVGVNHDGVRVVIDRDNASGENLLDVLEGVHVTEDRVVIDAHHAVCDAIYLDSNGCSLGLAALALAAVACSACCRSGKFILLDMTIDNETHCAE